MRSRLLKVSVCSLTMALAGCSTLGVGAPAVAGADVRLLQACGEPAGDAKTNGAIAMWLLAYREALRACNTQIETFKLSGNPRGRH